jgi:hypothetical protein
MKKHVPIAAIVVSVVAFTITMIVCAPWLWRIVAMPTGGEGGFGVIGEMLKFAGVFLAGMVVSLSSAGIASAYHTGGKHVVIAELQTVFVVFLVCALRGIGR